MFLRVDSRVLATATKAWLFPLLVVTIVLVGLAAVRIAGAAASAVLRGARDGALDRAAFAVTAGVLVGVEYAFLTLHHPVGSLWLAPVVVIAAGGVAWTATAATARSPSTESPPPRGSVFAAAVVATGVFALACTRPDVATALIKRNTALGRVLGHGLALVPRHVTATGAVVRPPDVRIARPLGPTSVVVMTIDALRRDALEPYGAPAGASPRIAAFAAGAVVADDVWAQVPSSAPSISTLWTGSLPAHHGVRENRMALDLGATTLAETLATAAYATAAFVTNPNFAPGFHLDQGFASYQYFPSTEREYGILLDASDVEAVDAALAWAKTARRPFFLWVHVMAPHSPYLPPADLRPDPARDGGPWFNVWNMGGDARIAPGRAYFDLGRYRRAYAAEVRSADRLAARLLDGLAADDLVDDAHVILSADHGEAFGENDVFAHGRSIDPAESRVPLVWRLPHGLRDGSHVRTTMQLADVTPTLLRLLGVAATTPHDGRDLSGVVAGEAADDDGFAFTQARFLHSMGVKGLLYAVRTRTRTLWLDAGYGYDGEYDRRRDPNEEHMRRYDPRPDDSLRRTLETLAHDAQASLLVPRLRGSVDARQLEQLRALGYVQ